MSQPTSTAVARMARDMRQLAREPIDGVTVGLRDNDVLRLSVNMVPREGVRAGHVVHIHLDFPGDYPARPPMLHLMTPLPEHPNVFGSWVCLDMLKEYAMGPYQGWSASYDLPAILLQLYGFLLVDDSVDQDYGGAVSRADCRPMSKKLPRHHLSCSCGHRNVAAGALPVEEETSAPLQGITFAALQLQEMGVSVRPRRGGRNNGSSTRSSSNNSSNGSGSLQNGRRSSSVSSVTSSSSSSKQTPAVPKLNRDVLEVILRHADSNTRAKVAVSVGGDLGKLASSMQQREETQCFFSKRSLSSSPDLVLGLGVKADYYRDGSVSRISIAQDLLAEDVFMAGHRLTAWNYPINAFLPMALNPQHATRALARLPHHIRTIMPQAAGTTAQGKFPHSVLLLIMAKAMNSLVVEMVMAGTSRSSSRSSGRPLGFIPGCTCPSCRAAAASSSSGSSSGASRHMSDAALSVFCHLHHLLLTVALQQPSMVEEARADAARFLRHPRQRSKEHCPDLGVLLIKLLLVPCDEAPWGHFAPALLRELLARQVFWAQREHGPSFTDDLLDAPEHRLSQHFSSARTSLRTVALEVWFANALARPTHAASLQQELAGVKAAYDRMDGRPPASVFARFNAHSRAVLAHSGWLDFLRSLRLGVRAPSAAAVQRSGGSAAATVRVMWANVLRQAVYDSRLCEYHKGKRVPLNVNRPTPRGCQPHCFELWDPAVPPVQVISEEW